MLQNVVAVPHLNVVDQVMVGQKFSILVDPVDGVFES
jgi:hypothetical protein